MIERLQNICMNGSASYVSHWCDSNQQEKLKEGNIYLAWKLRVPSITTGKSGRRDYKAACPIWANSQAAENSDLSHFLHFVQSETSAQDGAIRTQSESSENPEVCP